MFTLFSDKNSRMIQQQGISIRVAGRILMALKSTGHDGLNQEFARVLECKPDGWRTAEMERMELLGAIVQTLCATDTPQPRRRAALDLLERLNTEWRPAY